MIPSQGQPQSTRREFWKWDGPFKAVSSWGQMSWVFNFPCQSLDAVAQKGVPSCASGSPQLRQWPTRLDNWWLPASNTTGAGAARASFLRFLTRAESHYLMSELLQQLPRWALGLRFLWSTTFHISLTLLKLLNHGFYHIIFYLKNVYSFTISSYV